MKSHQLTGPKPRIDDGLGPLDAITRYRIRCRMSGKCPDCGKSVPHGRVRCVRCVAQRSMRNRANRAMSLWVSGAPLIQIERLVIGKLHNPRGGRPNPDGLIIACKCGRVSRIRRSMEGCICGADLWPNWVEATARRRWIAASDKERSEGLIG
ncbi:MAG: hypothetical protein ACO3IN_04600 [Steroidobacteraceae bacterium]|jgi:hypothetical protein